MNIIIALGQALGYLVLGVILLKTASHLVFGAYFHEKKKFLQALPGELPQDLPFMKTSTNIQ